MTKLPSSSRVNTTEAPCWLLHAVTWERRSTVVLTLWIWTHRGRVVTVPTIRFVWRHNMAILAVCWKRCQGSHACQPTFSCRSSSPIFHSETALYGEHLKKERKKKCFHGIGAQTCSALWNNSTFDTFIVFCLIYGSLLYNIFMLQFFFCLFLHFQKFVLHTSVCSLMQNILMNKLLPNKLVWTISPMTDKSHSHFYLFIYIMTTLIALINALLGATFVTFFLTETTVLLMLPDRRMQHSYYCWANIHH